PQSRRIDRALEAMQPEARACVREFLARMRDAETDRPLTGVED
ncbi:MAG: MarR family transcriptional regulator, partial [Agrobacterium vaccinii]